MERTSQQAEDAPVPSTPSSEPEEEGHEEGQPRQSRQQPPRQEVEDGGEDRVMPVADVMVRNREKIIFEPHSMS